MNKNVLIKFAKNRNNLTLLIIIISGVALMLFSSGEKKEPRTEESFSINVKGEEERLETILEKIDGAGDVSVMISYDETAKKNIAYEKNKNGLGENTKIEKAVLSDGKPLVINERYPSVRGILVICEGAADPKVKRALTEAVSTVMGTEAHKICVCPKSD